MTETKGRMPVRRLGLQTLFALAALAAAPFASADSLVVEASPLISGTQSQMYTFSTSSAGSVTVALANIDWPQRLSSLSFALATTSGVLATFGEGQQTVALDSAGTYYAIVTGIADSTARWNLGMYSLRMTFSALSGPNPTVPLPAAAWLLLSGIAGLFGLSRWKQELPPATAPAY